MLRLHDTATGTLETITPVDGGPVRLYVCGPTVYGPPHIGHGRLTLVYDVLRRYLESMGTVVRHVSNVTDIDDKIINRANDEGRPWRDIAAECEEAWWSSMDRMGLAKPHETPHATDFVPEMVELIAELADKGAAYELDDGVYLSVAEVPSYGLLAQQSLDSLRAGARVEVVAGKRTPMDFVLWKKVKPGEPSWPSPWGAGRPGWHTECVVMSLSLLGEGFELHGGGTDLKFPHHENERAQAVALGRQFAAHWMHTGMVEVGGEKMAKSVGNVRVGYSRRYKERYQIAKEQVVKGRVGTLTGGAARVFNSRSQALAMLRRNPHATPVVDALTYYVDLMNWLFEGRKVVEIYARGQNGVLKQATGYEVPDVSYAVLTYDDGAVVNLGVSYALPEKYPALGHAARVEVLGTGGVMILDDDHTDQLMYSETGVPHVYLPDHTVNMVFLQSGTPGDWALGEFWGPIANETRAWLDHLATGRPCTLATPQDARATLEATLAIEQSMRIGMAVTLPLHNG